MGAALRASDPGVLPLPLPAGLVERAPLASAAAARRREALGRAALSLPHLDAEARSDPYGGGGAALLAELVGGGGGGPKPHVAGRKPPSPERALEGAATAGAAARSGLNLTRAVPPAGSPAIYYDEWARRIAVHGAHAPLLSPAAWAGAKELLAPAALRSAFPGIAWLDVGGLSGRPAATLDFALGRLRAALGPPASVGGGASSAPPLAAPEPVAASVSLDVLGLPVVTARPAASPGGAIAGRPMPSVPPLALGSSSSSSADASLAWVSDLEGLCTAVSAPSSAGGAAAVSAAAAALPGVVSQWRVVILRAADWLAGDRGVVALASASPHITLLICFGSDDDVRTATRFLGRDAVRAQRSVAQQYKAATAASVAAAAAAPAVLEGGGGGSSLPALLEGALGALERASPAAPALRAAYDSVAEGRASAGQRLMPTPYDALCATLLALQEQHGVVLGVINPPPWGGRPASGGVA